MRAHLNSPMELQIRLGREGGVFFFILFRFFFIFPAPSGAGLG